MIRGYINNGLAGLLLLASTNFLFPAQKPVLAQEPPPQKQVQDIKALEDKLVQQPSNPDLLYQIASVHYASGNQAKAQDYFNKGVALDMQKKTCDEILAGAPVEFVKYNGKTKTTNFDELVFQEHLPVEKRMPVLVMVYHNDLKIPENSASKKEICKRGAILFKELSNQLNKKIRFVCYEAEIDSALAKNGYAGLVAKFEILAAPSLILYSPFDILKKEKRDQSKGIKRLDSVRGGPKTDIQIYSLWRDFQSWWLEPNLFGRENPENDGKIYRFMNTDEFKVAGRLTASVK